MNSAAKFCEHCGARLLPGNRFCEQCGAPVAESTGISPDASQKAPTEATPAQATPRRVDAPSAGFRRWILPAAVSVGLLALAAAGLALWLDRQAGPFDRPPSFEERFDESSTRWRLWEDADSAARIEEGVLRARVRPGEFRSAVLVGSDLSNVAIRVEARVEAGEGAFGILARIQGDRDFYQFVLSSDGQAIKGRTRDGKWVGAPTWEKVAGFRTGGAPNLLSVICQGGGLAFYVNGEVAASFPEDESPQRGSIGLFVRAWEGDDAPGMIVSFDNLQLWELK